MVLYSPLSFSMNMQDINHCEIKFRIQIFDLDACSSFVSQTVVACENRNMLVSPDSLSLYFMI